MPWKQPQPLQTDTDRTRALWNVEIWTRVKFFSFTWNPTAIAAATQATYTMAMTGSPDILTNACSGLRIGMGLKLTSPAVPAPGLVWDCTVLANDTLTIWIQNLSGAAATPPGGTWQAMGVIT